MRSLILLAELGPDAPAPGDDAAGDPPAGAARRPKRPKKKPAAPPGNGDEKAGRGGEDGADPAARSARRTAGLESPELGPGEGVADGRPGAPAPRPTGDEGGEPDAPPDPVPDVDDPDGGEDGPDGGEDGPDGGEDGPDGGTDGPDGEGSDGDPDAEPGTGDGAEDPVEASVRRERLYDALAEVELQAKDLADAADVYATRGRDESGRRFASRARDLAAECARQVGVARGVFPDLGYERARDVYASARERVGAVAELLKHLIDGDDDFRATPGTGTTEAQAEKE